MNTLPDQVATVVALWAAFKARCEGSPLASKFFCVLEDHGETWPSVCEVWEVTLPGLLPTLREQQAAGTLDEWIALHPGYQLLRDQVEAAPEFFTSLADLLSAVEECYTATKRKGLN